jgi:Xaa-Pro aminopeptidase
MNIDKLQSILEKNNLDIALFYTSDSAKYNPNMFYLSGYNSLGLLIIPKKQSPFLVAPAMEFETAKKSDIKKVYCMKKKRFFESVYEVIKKNNIRCKKIGIDYNNFSLNSFKYLKKQFKGMKKKDIFLDCLKLRQIKTGKEILSVKKSCDYASKVLQKALSSFKDFKTESEVAAFLGYETKKLGLEMSFNPVVASGSNGSMPHHEAKDTKLKNGFCVIDFGVKYKGYCSDITRTIYLGKPSKGEIEAYDGLLKTQEDIVNNIKINDKCSDIYDSCVKSMGKNAKYFIHGLGHGIGVEIHELPNITMSSKDRIMEGMAFTIEPGIYFPGSFGIRIEDSILMMKKPIILTKVPKDLLVI